MLTYHPEVFEKLRRHETLGEDEVRGLRHAAGHPDFKGSIGQSLGAMADLHEAARRTDERAAAGVSEEDDRRPSLTHAEIQQDLRRVLGPSYSPSGGRRGRR
jgi:hypothetical protein